MTWTWNADPSNATTLTFSGCGTSPRALGTDLGTFTLQPADFRATSTCAVELTITRQQLISASAAFPRATLAARQKRTVIVETTP